MQKGANLGIAPFSNINPTLCAPGVGIVSANFKGGLVAKNGASMACLHVAGAAALWWQSSRDKIGHASGDVVRAQLVASARASGFDPAVTYVDRGAVEVRVPQ
jgi:subtilisin family serine protease